MWQRLYEELAGKRFVVLAVAMESRGAEAARPWIEKASPTYPCLLDPQHLLGELYGVVNVPQAVWIDEGGRIVRPTETAGTTDAFRSMDRTDFSMPEAAREEIKQARGVYVGALRDWVEKGGDSEHVFAAEEGRRRLDLPDERSARAHASFRLGQHLRRSGKEEEGDALLREAIRLRPESWSFWRQTADLEEVGKSGGPEFWARVDALGEDRYYAPVDMKGMPR